VQGVVAAADATGKSADITADVEDITAACTTDVMRERGRAQRNMGAQYHQCSHARTGLGFDNEQLLRDQRLKARAVTSRVNQNRQEGNSATIAQVDRREFGRARIEAI